MRKIIPDKLEEIPETYLNPSGHPGKVEVFEYNTYDSFHYGQDGRQIHKKALIYLPYGYDDTQKHDIFYLMHGGWGNEKTYLGNHRAFPKSNGNSYGFKNIVDHAIEDKKIKPMIIVCPTYNNDSWSYEKAIRLTSLYPQELVHDLIPSVESRYHTYADGVTEEELKASRMHRGFGGFSMGSVCTWHVFDNCLSYFHFFIAMSGNCGDGSQQDVSVKKTGLSMKDFFHFYSYGIR